MNRVFTKLALLLGLSLGLLASCKKQEVVPATDFSYALSNKALAQYISVFPSFEPIQLTNNSTDGATYLWDFGGGTTSTNSPTSTEKEPLVTFPKAGKYTITLTSTSATGGKSTATKTITIAEKVLRRIIVSRLDWNAFGNLPTWTGTKNADLTLEIGQLDDTSGPIVPASVLYQSASARVANSATAFDLPVTGRWVLDPTKEINLVYNLYGNDGGGKQLVYSSGGSGIGFASHFDTTTKYYTVGTAFQGTALTLLFDYE